MDLTPLRSCYQGRLASVRVLDATDAQLSQITYGYDAHGRVSTVTDARNGTTIYGYNAADRVTSVTTPPPGTGQPAQTTATEYNTLLQATKITHPDGTTTTNEYHLTGALKQTAGSRAYPVGYGYDDQGRLTTMTNWTAFSTGAGARVTTWNYDAQRGWLASKRDAEDKGPSYTYTPGGRLKTRTWSRGVGMTNIYGFDDGANGNDFADLVQVVYTGGSNTVTQAYDRQGRVASVVHNGMTTAFSYNDAGLLTGESYSGGTLAGLMVTNSYDSCLRRAGFGAKVTGGANLVTNQFAYDAGSRLSSVTDGTNSAAYGYHTNSSLISQTTFKQNSTTRLTTWRSYDRLNRLMGISSTPAAVNQLPLSFQYSYNDANQRIRVGLHDGSYWLYEYDALGQVKSGKRYWADGTPVAGQQYEYAHDDIGNRTETEAGGDSTGSNLRTAEYGANSLNQYTNRAVPGYVDVLGIGTATAAVTVNGTGAYRRKEYFHVALAVDNSSGPQYPSIVIQAVAGANSASSTGRVFLAKTPEVFVHDADGNLTQDGRWAYTWDGENRLMAMEALSTVPSAAKLRLEFEYDWRGRRIGKTVKAWSGTSYTNVCVLKFLYDGWNLAAELDANNAVVRSYIWGTDLSGSDQGAGGVGGLLAVNVATNGVHFPAYDGNGNIAGLVSAASGAITARYEYGPFAEPIRVSGPIAKAMPLRFSTKYLDEETGFYYYGYRYYDPSTGRWLSRDPIGERGGLNRYAFVGNSPANFNDYLGAWPQLYQDPETGMIGIADTYDVHYLGAHRAVACREIVPNSLIWSGAPLEHARLDMFGGNSLSMAFGPTIGSIIGEGSRALPTFVGAAGLVGEAGAGLFLVVVPEPALSKVGGAMLLADAADNLQTLFRGSDQTLFEQGVGSLPWMNEKDKKRACCVKNCSVMILAFATGPKANSPLRLRTAAAESGAMRNVVQFEGMEVRAVRDLSHVEQGTLEAMQQHGFAATTVNGDSIVLHHLDQNPAGPLVEMPAANHSIWNSVQHPLGNTAGAGLSAAERASYNAWRTEYWQWRATQELKARRVLGQ